MKRHHVYLAALALVSQAPFVLAEQQKAPGMSEYVTCAVYFRMIAGSIQSHAGPDSVLADLAKGKMSTLADAARASAAKEFGTEHAEDKFDAAWRATLKDMTDQINRNYDNVTHLRYRYGDRCEALFKKTNQD